MSEEKEPIPQKKKKKSQHKGLRRMRKNIEDKKPTHHCENCKCYRYSPCTCTKKAA